MPKPENDGITHINVYSKAKTELGRFLSNFAYCPIETEDGPFTSIEGYWYWLSCKDDRLRRRSGYGAKQLGQELGGQDWVDDAEFKRKICAAIDLKMQTEQAKYYLEKYKSILHLPLKHYYVYGKKAKEPKQGKWIIEHLEKCTGQSRL